MTVGELKQKLNGFDDNLDVVSLNDITFTSATYRSPEQPQEFPYKVESLEDVLQGEDRGKTVVFLHNQPANLF
jgi:hypothetical protein